MDSLTLVKSITPEIWREVAEAVAVNEHWALSFDDFYTWQKAFGDDFVYYVYLEKETKKLACSLCRATYEPLGANSKAVTTIGMFYTDPKYRGKGVGTKLFQLLVEDESLKNHNKALVGVSKMHAKYSARHGFDKEPEFTLDCYYAIGSDFKTELLSDGDIDVKNASEVGFDAIYKYDKTICPDIDRSKYVEAALEATDSVWKVALDSDKNVVGVIRARQCAGNQVYIGPFYADTDSVAEGLLKATLTEIPHLSTVSAVSLLLPSTNQKCYNLFMKASQQKFKLADEMHGQFTKEVLKAPAEKVYAIFECALSYI